MTAIPLMTDGSTGGSVEVKKEHLTYEWVLKDVKLLPQEVGESIYSPIFRTVNSGAEWRLRLYPQGRNEDTADSFGIFLYLHSLNDGIIKIKVDAEISIPRCSTVHEFEYEYKKDMTHGFGENNIIQKPELLKLCAPDDSVSIHIKINLSWETLKGMEYLEEALSSQEGQLSQAFRPLFKESKFSDVVVIVGNEKFPAHKLVLAARSPVFSAMFENKESQENLNNEVKIEEMEPAVVNAMLEFFYTDKVENLEELVYGLLGAAEKYDIPGLRIMCEKVLYNTLNKENAAQILVYADLYRLHKLKEYVMKFMDDYLFDVVETEGYKEMKNLELLKEFIRSVGVRKGPKK